MKGLEEGEHLCANCERDKREADELRFKRLDVWNAAARLLEAKEWPEDGKPVPSDILHLAEFLMGED